MSGLYHFDFWLNPRVIIVINVHPSLNVNKTPLATVTLLLHAKNCRRRLLSSLKKNFCFNWTISMDTF